MKPGDLVRVKMGNRGEPMRVPMFPHKTGTPSVDIPSGSLCLVLEVRENSMDRTRPVITILTQGQLLSTNGIYMESVQ
ncbi:MAG: hypothetical protein EBZ49_08955 [Proteobacteria bacterium]|nr:hypothetical protein [Pseudomonadota bacterium]